MNDVTNLPDAIEQPRKLTRAESLEKARAAKAAKSAAAADEETNQAVTPMSVADKEMQFWGQAFVAAMQNFQVKSPAGLEPCAPIADRALEMWRNKMQNFEAK